MPNRLPYHQRRLIAKGQTAPIVVEAVEEFDVEDE